MIYNLKPKIIRKVWGGKKLESLKSISSLASLADDLEPIGETWEISHHPLSGLPLTYLAKFIDTSAELSIQVHPGDEYARLHENSSGKTECWIILSADKDAGIYLGLKPGVTEAQLRNWLSEKKSIDQLLNFYPVIPGNYFYVPAGSIHAIGKNVMLAEVQQHSGITYRVWDWNRDRELHVDKSLDVINFNPRKNEKISFDFKPNIFQKNGRAELVRHSDFKVDVVTLNKGEKIEINEMREYSVLNLAGKIKIHQGTIEAYQSLFINDEITLLIEAIEDGSFLLIS
jgi:mannose-6-phosphate isomerase